jgi:NAD+ synthetase
VKIALAQLNYRVGDLAGNGTKIKAAIQKAAAAQADMVVFSELAICGYPPRDLLDRPDFRVACRHTLDDIVAYTARFKGMAVVLGTPLASPEGLKNAAVVLLDGETVFVHHKIHLPHADVFEERRHFRSGERLGAWEFKGIRIGVTVCEDLWQAGPAESLAEKGISVLLNLSASPFYMGKDKLRYDVFSQIAALTRCPVVFVNQIGGQDQLIFDGHSMVVHPSGRFIAELPSFKERVQLVDLASPRFHDFVSQHPDAGVYEGLVLGIRDYVTKSGFSQVALGLSGGIDSAVVAVLACAALGGNNVLGVLMPSPYTAEQSSTDAQELAQNLGMATIILPISEAFSIGLSTLKTALHDVPDIVTENLQARIRGNFLMALSNAQNRLILTTGNKSELAVGYCTLYGDMAGALAVIGDLFKTRVYQLAQFINQTRTLIPKSIISRPPTAELRPGQKDEDSLPPYRVLDGILKAYLEDVLSLDEITELGYPRETAEWVIRKLYHNEYKRLQAPPILKVTPKAFGMGRLFLATTAWQG